MLPLVSADYRALAEARLALAANAANADAAAGQGAGAAARAIPGWPSRRRAGGARRTITTPPRSCCSRISDNPVASGGVVERAARSSPAGCWPPAIPRTAYQLVHQHGSSDDNAVCRGASSSSGYIALRFRKDPALAFDHFAHILARVDQPLCQGARRLLGRPRRRRRPAKPDLATKWYAAGAEHMATFYGQLAAHQLGKDAPPQPVPEPRPNGAEQARFDAQELVRAARLFFAAGDRDHARTFLMQMADGGEDAARIRDAGVARRVARPDRPGDRGGAARDRRRHAADGARLSGHRAARAAAPPSVRCSWRSCGRKAPLRPTRRAAVGARGLMQLMPGDRRRASPASCSCRSRSTG